MFEMFGVWLLGFEIYLGFGILKLQISKTKFQINPNEQCSKCLEFGF